MKHQRLVDQAVDDQPVVLRIDLGDAAVVALEAEPVRRDDAVELVQRREAHRRLAARGQPLHVAADDMRLVLRRLAVGPHRDAVAERRGSIPARWAAGSSDCRRAPGPPISAAPEAPARRRGNGGATARLVPVAHGALHSTTRDDSSTNGRQSEETISQKIAATRNDGCARPPSRRPPSRPAFGSTRTRLLRRHVFLHQLPDRRALGALVHARPAGDHVVAAPPRSACRTSGASAPEMRLPIGLPISMV